MQGYPNGGAYYGHPQYVPQPQPVITHYTPYPPYAPPQGQAAAYQPWPTTAYPEPQDVRPPYPNPAPRPKHLQRSQSAAAQAVKPLKSAMKKPVYERGHDRSYSMGEAISREPSRESSHPTRERANSSTRPRTNSIPAMESDHIFLTFVGTNEIRMESIMWQNTIDELQERVLPIWPHGVSSQGGKDHSWRVTFGGSPWSSSGTDFILARKMITTIFYVLANQGYSYLATVNTGALPARLVFVRTPEDPQAVFFTMALSQEGGKLTFLDAPSLVVQTLSNNLRATFPRRVASDRASADGVHVIELRKSSSGPDVDKGVFIAYVLRYFNQSGFKLDGSLPMGKSSALGFGSKKELWVFRGRMARPGSAHSRRSVDERDR